MSNKKGASFLVGIDKYDDRLLKDLSSTSYHNVEAINAVLGLPASQYMPPSDEFKLVGNKITNNKLVTQLTKFLSIAEYTDILIYFSGHGYQVWDTNDNDGIWKGYLATSNSVIEPYRDREDSTKFLDQNNGLAFTRIASMIEQASITKTLKSLVLLIDACYSGHAITNEDLQLTLLKLRQKSTHNAQEDYFKYCIMGSSLSSEESWIEGNMGAFTKILCKELSRSDSGPITTEGLEISVQSNFVSRHQQIIKPDHAGRILLMNYSSTGAEKTIDKPILDEDIDKPLSPRNPAVENLPHTDLDLARLQSIDTVSLESEIGVKYDELRNLLRAGQWKEADKETLKLMLKVPNAMNIESLDSNSFNNFPCKDLKTIDSLWKTASDGHFGFSIQMSIWRECGSSIAYDDNLINFFDRVGWHKQRTWVNFLDLNFNPTISTPGELPYSWIIHVWKKNGGYSTKILSVLSQRLMDCCDI